MLRQDLLPPDTGASASLHPVELFLHCAADREDAALWSELLRRYAGRIKFFIRGALRRSFGTESDPGCATVRGAVQESDLLQNVILRLVENDCAAMKRFSGATEDELLAYLAVIARSVVIDTLRRNRKFQRPAQAPADRPGHESVNIAGAPDVAIDSGLERRILARELAALTQRTMKCLSGPALSRDQLVFDLYFSHGLSFRQIARCKGINLTKTGVENIIYRLIDRVRSSASAQIQGKL